MSLNIAARALTTNQSVLQVIGTEVIPAVRDRVGAMRS